MKKIIVTLVIIAVIGALLYWVNSQRMVPLSDNQSQMNPTATLKTSKGDIVLEIYEQEMPITTTNFLKLAEEDFYDGVKFHRVMEGFMIQAGDPNSKEDNPVSWGQGGPGYTIEDEFNEFENNSNVRGTIAMANTGQPNSGGSQWFINLVDNLYLDYDNKTSTSAHPVFGRVIEGMDIVDEIGSVTVTQPRNIPVEPIIIEDIVISRN